jgi:transcriptional regulator with GAF, ATPase, and Fis domain
MLEPADLPITTPRATPQSYELPARGLSLEDVERTLVQQALERTHWNQTRAAKLLGINRDQIHYRIEKFKLTPPPGGSGPSSE